MQTIGGRRTLKEAAQMAILALYAGRDVATAAEVAEATRAFALTTAERARAELTAEGTLRHGYTGRPGKSGYHYYEIDRGNGAQVAKQRRRSPRTYRSRTTRDDDRLRHGTRATTDDEGGYDDEDDYDVDEDRYELDEDGYESSDAAGSGWGWILTIAVFVCGLGFVLVRRASVLLPIGTAAGPIGMPLSPYNPPSRAPRTYQTVAPHPGDDAIFGPDPVLDETWDHRPVARLTTCDDFATFPGFYDFGPEREG